MYKNLIELFKENEGKGAVGAFNLHCFEMLPAMIQAAEELNVQSLSRLLLEQLNILVLNH